MSRLFFISLIVICNSAFSQGIVHIAPNYGWPVNTSTTLIIHRGRIAGSPSEYREPYSGSPSIFGVVVPENTHRFHMGVDITASDGTDNTVYSIEPTSTIRFEGTGYNSRVLLANTIYWHVQQNADYVNNVSVISPNEAFGNMTSDHVHIQPSLSTLPGAQSFFTYKLPNYQDYTQPQIINTYLYRNGHNKNTTGTQLNQIKRINGRDYISVYNKIDLVVSTIDSKVGADGNSYGSGNIGPNQLSYQMVNSQGINITNGYLTTLDFSTLPNHTPAISVFGAQTDISNPYYVLTSGFTEPYDRYWNTGKKIGMADAWPTDNSLDARSIQETAFPDDTYTVNFRIRDVDSDGAAAGNFSAERTTWVVVDNYLPYVKEVIIKQTSSIGPVVYHKKYDWDATTGQLNFTINDKPNDATPLGKLWVKVITSEPMKTLKLTISGNDPGPIITDPTPVVNTNNKEFVKEYNAIFGSGRQTITIAGTDLADNNLLTDPAQNSLRLADGTWPTSATQGTDTSHGFIIGTNTCASNFPGGRTDGTTCLYVEYSASSTNVATNEPVTFTPVVSGTGAITYNWNFGAGATPATATTVGPHMVVYNSTGTKSISLTVTDATGTKSKSGTLNVLTTSPSVDFSATPTSGVAPLTVYYSDRSAGTVSTRSWNFPGGNPSTSTSANPVVVYNIAGNYDATLVVNGTASTTKPGIVSVNSAQPLSATISHCSNYYFVNCSGGSYDQNQQVFFSTTVSGGMPFYSYQWNFGDGNTSTSSTPANIYSSLGNFTVTLVVTDRNGAKVTATTSLSVVTIFPFIDANFYASDTYIDTGDGPVTFTDATSSNVNPNRLTYYWDFGEGASPRYAYTKGPHTVCYFNIPITKEVYMRVHDPVSYKTDDHRLQINVVKSNVDQCTNYSPQWTTTSGAAAGAAIGTCLYPNETTGINNGNLSQLNCVLSTTSANTECVFDVTKSCFSDTWFQSHGNVMLRKEAKTYFNFAAAGLHDASRNYLATISEGIFYQHPENFKVGKRYVFTFFAKVRDLFHWRIDHLKISLATGLVPSVDNCNRGLEIYQPPTYPFSLHQLGSFDYAINSKFELKCFEVYFYPPNNNFNQIWIYPDVEASLLNRVGTQVDQRILITDFSLRSGNSGDNFYCAPDIIVKNSVPGLTQSSITLKTQGTVNLPSGQTTTYRAGEVITLKPGFSAASGSVFKASIGSCTGSSGREDALIPSAPTFDDYDLFRQDYRTPNQFTGLLVLAPDRSEIEDEYLLTVTPSPANDKITVRSTLKQQSSIEISIVSLVGVVVDNRLISETKNIEEEFAIRLLSPGVYFVRIKSSEGVVVRKFVKL